MTIQEHRKILKEYDESFILFFKEFEKHHQPDPAANELLKFSYWHAFLAKKWEENTGLTVARHFAEFNKWCQVIEQKK